LKLSPKDGRQVIKILCNDFGFQAIRQKSSHVTLTNSKIYITVPAKRIGIGLLDIILKDAEIDREEFLKADC